MCVMVRCCGGNSVMRQINTRSDNWSKKKKKTFNSDFYIRVISIIVMHESNHLF